MSDFGALMHDAFVRLAVQEACPQHKWSKPKRHAPKSPVMLRVYGESWDVTCRLCGRVAGRPTLARLKAEVLDKP